MILPADATPSFPPLYHFTIPAKSAGEPANKHTRRPYISTGQDLNVFFIEKTGQTTFGELD
jgi:hypothetical protein